MLNTIKHTHAQVVYNTIAKGKEGKNTHASVILIKICKQQQSKVFSPLKKDVSYKIYFYSFCNWPSSGVESTGVQPLSQATGSLVDYLSPVG